MATFRENNFRLFQLALTETPAEKNLRKEVEHHQPGLVSEEYLKIKRDLVDKWRRDGFFISDNVLFQNTHADEVNDWNVEPNCIVVVEVGTNTDGLLFDHETNLVERLMLNCLTSFHSDFSEEIKSRKGNNELLTTLMWVVYQTDHDYATCVLYLLRTGANISETYTLNLSILEMACSHDHVHTVILLLLYGADVNHVDFVGGNAVMRTVAENGPNSPEILTRLIQNGAILTNKNTKNNTVFHVLILSSIESKNKSIKLLLDILLNQTLDINAQNNSGDTPLMCLLESIYLNDIQLVLQCQEHS